MPDNDITTEKKQTPQEFAAVLLKHAAGRAHDEASDQLRRAVEAVKATGKDATVKVEVKVKAVANIPNAVKLATNVTATIPKETPTSMWFSDDDNRLHRNDPNQPALYGDAD